MAITVLPDVELEYVAKRDQIVGYPTIDIDQDLARLEALAGKVDDYILLLQGREALNGRPADTEQIRQIRAQVDIIHDCATATGLIRTAIAELQAKAAAFGV